MKKLKIYVWEGILADWTSGLAFALANTKKEAIEILYKKYLKDIKSEGGAELFKNELLIIEPIVKTTKCGFYIMGGG